MQISFVIPLFNEEESLPELEAWIRRVMEANGFSYEIVFVDDGSTDRSWQVIEQLLVQNPKIRAIKFRRNYGKSAALNSGFQLVSGDVVITLDADLQDSPDEAPELYRMIAEEGWDLVSGWKKMRYDPITKTVPSKFFNAITRRISKISLHDFNCGLKAYKREVVKTIEIYGEMHRYIPLLAKWAGFTKITEKVVEHRPRKFGVTKFGWERFVNGFLDLLSITFVGKFGKRPMHFFGSMGTLSFFAGFVILVYLSIAKLIYSEYGIAERPLFFFGILAIIIGTQLFVTGFLAELVARNAPQRNAYVVEKEIGGGKE
ncbi:MAG: glycosyltransferase family 2 protein [Saprospirales bacterium]|nr:glycosyltransferase family 2 protein [Saprospirales bacterium]MBK6901837.1 glycosyltransferase family 2 protein [Saprospirales bacterium]